MGSTIREVMQTFLAYLDLAGTANLQADLQLKLSGADSYTGYLRLDHGTATIYEGEAPQPNLTIKCTFEVMQAVARGEKDPLQAFILGEIQASGDINLGMRLLSLLKIP
ncbi:MAG: SCP2 sterol-binding domain-containing protein [Chloroflexi bacterium]|nr:SCP2 sterol-binding domain-containing protein [Chloroflexota bacterium]